MKNAAQFEKSKGDMKKDQADMKGKGKAKGKKGKNPFANLVKGK